MSITQDAIRAIEEQQKKLKGNTAPWMVGEQLKDICRREPRAAEFIAQDLNVPEMSLVEAEKKIKAYADKHKTGSFACVPPAKAEEILREFYGLKTFGATPEATLKEPEPQGVCINLSDFFG